MNMQIFSLAGTLFSLFLRPEPLCPCHCSAEGAGLKSTFCQGRYFCLLVVRAVGRATLASQDGPGAWPWRCWLLCGGSSSGSSIGNCCIAAPDTQRLTLAQYSKRWDMSCEEMSIKGAQGVNNKAGEAAVLVSSLFFLLSSVRVGIEVWETGFLCSDSVVY